MSKPIPQEVILQLQTQERRMKRVHGLRIAVTKMTADGTNVLCNAWRSRSPLFRLHMEEHEMVSLAHEALRPLFSVGVNPLISIVERSEMENAAAMDKNDPFGLLAAITTAGVSEQGHGHAPSVPTEETERRKTMLEAARKVPKG